MSADPYVSFSPAASLAVVVEEVVMGRSIGLDVHRDFCEVTLADGGRARSAGRVATTPEELALFAQSLAADDRVVAEATGNALAIARLIEPHAGEVVLANARQLKAISHARVKTDKLDARVLADLLAADHLTACLRTGRALRVPRARTRMPGKKFVSPEIMISERPAETEDRAVPGHWEGDLILGLGSSAIGTLVERTTRFTMLLRLPRLEGHGAAPRTKNGPALAGHGAQAVRDAIATTIGELPEHLRRTLTWDQGAEMAQHAELRIDSGVAIYFCGPHSPWQRGTNENTNGLLRQYFPKGTDLSRHSERELAAVAATLNSRPRKTLGWRTPAEALDELLRSVREGGFATTP